MPLKLDYNLSQGTFPQSAFNALSFEKSFPHSKKRMADVLKVLFIVFI